MNEPTAALIGPFARPSDVEPLTRADLLVAVDRGIDHARGLGIVPALVVGDFDSVSDAGRQWAFDPANGIIVVEVASEKDFTDLDLAFRTCLSRQVYSIDLYGFVGGRLDHQLAVVGVCARYMDRATIRLIGDGEIAHFIPVGQAGTVEKGVRFSVLALGDQKGGEVEVSIEGARYPLRRQRLPLLSDQGVSNIADVRSVVTVHTGRVALITSL